MEPVRPTLREEAMIDYRRALAVLDRAAALGCTRTADEMLQFLAPWLTMEKGRDNVIRALSSSSRPFVTARLKAFHIHHGVRLVGPGTLN
jgi:hypothetical protein